jgi:hypothetical protein
MWQTEGLPNGIEPIKPASPVNMYVNVTAGIMNIVAEDFLRARIYDISGKMMMESEQASIFVSQLPKGIYIVWVQTGKGIVRQKILIK